MDGILALIAFFAGYWLLFQLRIRLFSWRSSRPIRPGAPVRVTWYLEAPDKAAAERIRAALGGLDLYGEIEEPDPDPEEPEEEDWQVVASERAGYLIDRLQERRRELDAVATQHGGRCRSFQASRGDQVEWHGDPEAEPQVEDIVAAATVTPIPIKRHLLGGRGTVRVGPGEILVAWADGRSETVPLRDVRAVSLALHPPLHERVVVKYGSDTDARRLQFLVRRRHRDELAEALGF